jgi:hypothetical protein
MKPSPIFLIVILQPHETDFVQFPHPRIYGQTGCSQRIPTEKEALQDAEQELIVPVFIIVADKLLDVDRFGIE